MPCRQSFSIVRLGATAAAVAAARYGRLGLLGAGGSKQENCSGDGGRTLPDLLEEFATGLCLVVHVLLFGLAVRCQEPYLQAIF